MRAYVLLLLLVPRVRGNAEDGDPILYYYGLEENERGLPACGARQACSAQMARYWRPPALVRLCRCARRQRCDVPAPPDHRVELNNRAYLQFCSPVTSWPVCAVGEWPLLVRSQLERMSPDEIEQMHHRGEELSPPVITATCGCRSPYYWRLRSIAGDEHRYQCSSLPLCRTGEECGRVRSDLYALHQSCLCPRRHMCVHDGGVPRAQLAELLYSGTGWKAYCRRIDTEDSYEDY